MYAIQKNMYFQIAIKIFLLLPLMEMKKDPLLKKRSQRYFIDLVLQKAWAGLRVEATRGYLGFLWWIIEPVMYMAVFYTVFVHLLHRGDKNYVMFLLTGLVTWKWFQATINAGSNSLMVNAGLMNQVYLPKIIFPLTNIAINTFKFFIIFILFLLFLLLSSTKPTLTWLLVPFMIILQLFVITSLTSLLAAIMPFFPDLRAIIDNLLMMFLFLSGIFFRISDMPESVQKYLLLNPMAVIISSYRNLLLDGILPDWKNIICVIVFALVILLIALYLFRRFDRIYPKIIH